MKFLLILFSLYLGIVSFNLAWAGPSLVPHHDLTITIMPEEHALTLEDIITFPGLRRLSDGLEFFINRNIVIDEIRLNESALDLSDILEQPDTPGKGQRINISIPKSSNLTTPPAITVHYHGTISDMPKGTPGLRFTTPDKTTGYIGPEGVYLTSETLWYPMLHDSLATFRVQSTVPSGWETVTQGEEVSRVPSQNLTISTWNIPNPSEALTLVANHFITQKQLWNGVTLATYLFPEDATLADQYLTATAKYLDMYTKLLGPYPFSKFAVVENFFPAGIGLPSYTLLGKRIIKRGYTQPYSLGHEIVHSWFGNSIYNHFDRGNWVEGLTTYLSNYYYEEAHAGPEAALKKRQHMLHEYNLYATEPNEYPVRAFHHKKTRLDNAIGYQKTAMVFHMLRQEVGDSIFFDSIRSLVREWTGKHVDWSVIEHLFSQASGKDLHWFFEQWVERTGSPTIHIERLSVQEDVHNPGQFYVTATIKQQKPHYRLRLPAVVHLADGTTHHTVLSMTDQEQTVKVSTPARPTRFVIDPDFMVLRRLTRDQIPPMLNIWVTDTGQAVLLDENSTSEEKASYEAVLHRLGSQGTVPQSNTESQTVLSDASYLILGHPHKSNVAQHALAGCHDDVHIDDKRITIQGETFEGADIAWLVSCPNPDNPTHVTSLFYGFSPSAISRVARLLFFYGWDSYLVFQNGKVIRRGLFGPSNNNLDVLLTAA